MKKILGFLLSAKVLAVIGLLALAVVIWLIGPMLGIGAARPLESPAARGIVIMALVLAWVLNLVRQLLKANKANKGMAEGLVDAKAAGGDRSQEEVGALKQRFEQALEVLKKSKGKKGRLSLYDLPWYIIIGPPGSGKTTALVNSGLEFPLAEKYGREALSGVGGTRNCDWWFTDEAILVDTAGRYTTQDSDASVDRSAWEGFLALLKKYRRRRPINGVVVAISLLDLMTLSEHERLAHARAIKTRIQELDKFFKIRFPVYVILTKTDLVAGFMEFFEDLNKNEREQIWGATFPIDLSDSAEGAVPKFAPEFDALLERLNARLLWRMSQERDPRRRAAIYGFPRQLASLRDNLGAFLVDVFRGSSFEEAPMLRGVYFTSGTQEGTPIDRLMGMVARTFGLEQHALPAQGGRGRSYFLKALLKDVVFRESEIAGTNRKFESQRAWVQKTAYLGSFAILGLLVAGWVVSYLNNRALIGEAQAATTAASQAVAAAPATGGDVLALLPALEAVKKIPAVYDGGGRWLGLGLDQGSRLQSRAEIAYRNMLRETLLPRLLARTADHLRAGGSTPDFQYEALKAYLMIDSREHYDARAVIEWFAYDYATYLAPRAAPGDRDVYLAHLNALFAEQPVPLVVPLDQNLIEQTQRIVARMPVEERVYSRLKNSGDAKALRDLALFDLAGPRAQIVFVPTTGPGIDGFFTRDGYQKFFAARSTQQASVLVDESWILGPYAPTDLDAAAVVGRAKQLYLNEFAGEYEKLFATVKLAGFSTVEEATSVLNILSDPASSPLLLLLKNAAEQTQLAAPAAAAAAGGAAPGDRLGGVLGGQAPAAAPAAADDTQVIDRRLGWVRERLGADPASAPIGQVLKQLDSLFQFMQGVGAARGADGQIPNTLLEPGRAVFQQVRNASSREPAMIQVVMRDAVARSEALVFTGVRSLRQSEWRTEALPFCKRAIADHYPIKSDSEQDISPEDFGKFFAPNGLADAYFKNYLANYVDTSRRPWTAKPTAGDVSISPDALRQFERAAAIRDTFFMGGGQVPSVSFELRPVGMSETITQFTLDLAGQTVTYSHGPVQPQTLQWPGPKPDGDVRMEMAPAAAGESLRRVSGPWSWFKILDKATITPGDRADTLNVVFTLGSRSATYLLKARSTNNPFQFPDLHQFACPESL